ncbi:hypothetical protein BK127_12905 [Paenibacillus sp. FSL H7-0331]|nr:hypothetical protein BK127_12905 [Paenibacillus sp. FSL H7-0331]
MRIIKEHFEKKHKVTPEGERETAARIHWVLYDKTDEEEKREVISVEEFIGRLIRHIPDENFKTIRYYGVYSRRIKSLWKKLVSEWQKAASVREMCTPFHASRLQVFYSYE